MENMMFDEKELNRCAGVITVEMVDDEQFVSARELHERLEIKGDFRHWFPRMCEYGFKENEDYFWWRSKITATKNQHTTDEKEVEIDDYRITIDMAKHICMLQRSEAGKKFRQYFIDIEKKYRKENEEYLKARSKSKQVRNAFTDELHDRGYKKKHEYIQTTMQMRRELKITAKKDDMSKRDLLKVTMAECLASLRLTDEYGYPQVNPKCVEASKDAQYLITMRQPAVA